MKKISEKVLEDDLVMSLLENVTDAERNEFLKWLEETTVPLDGIVFGMMDLVSTEKSAEKLCDAINSFGKEAGLHNV